MTAAFFVDRATRDDAHRLMQELMDHAEQLHQAFCAITASYAESPGPFPERLHIGSLIGRFLLEYAQTLAE